MTFKRSISGLAVLAGVTSIYASGVHAADIPVKAPPKTGAPFFLLIDDRISVSWIPQATGPGSFSIKPNGQIDGKTFKQVYTFTHFDIWTYGTNLLNISLIKSDHNDPANPCTNAGVIVRPGVGIFPANCAGASEIYGFSRSTLGWNELFGTQAFTVGPLRNISFVGGFDFQADNHYLGAAKRAVLAGLQFQFALPYKGYINAAPMLFDQFSGHNSFLQCNSGFSGNIPFPSPGATCIADGNRVFQPTWSVEANYYMDLGFLPENMQFWSISGRAAWYGKKGSENAPVAGTPTAVEFNSEPIRLTLDASKAFWGDKFSHYVDVWVAYRYWQNKYGLDASASRLCNIAPGVSNHTCIESSVTTGVTMKF